MNEIIGYIFLATAGATLGYLIIVFFGWVIERFSKREVEKKNE